MAGSSTGDALETQTYTVTRADLVAYAGASGDHNPIHWSDRVAVAVGLPGVVAHGMLTMALGGRALATWAGDPARVRQYGVRFTRPVVVPDDDTGTEIVVSAVARPADEPGLLRLDITASCHGEKILAQARATVRQR